MTRSRFLLMGVSGLAALSFGCGPLPTATLAAAEEGAFLPDRAVDHLSVASPSWHRGAGLLYGEVTIRNRNPYSVVNVIITCDFFDEWGNPIGSKGTTLRIPVPPGKMRFSGIEFPITTRNMQAGACRAISAERL
jgi:hypothetical protein